MDNFQLSLITLFVTTGLIGCSAAPQKDFSLYEARTDYSDAQNNLLIVRLAPRELKQAGDAIDKANAASERKESADVVNCLAAAAKLRVAIALATARQHDVEMTVIDTETLRREARFGARTDIQSVSHKSAAVLLRQEEMKQQRAAMMRLRAHETKMRNSQIEMQGNKNSGRGLTLILGKVLFDTDSAELKSGGTHSLEKLAGNLMRFPNRNALIDGYTDNRGSMEYNQELSDRRAIAVRKSLVDMGISIDRIILRGRGQDSPIASNDTTIGRRLNRRVEVTLSDDSSEISFK